MVKLVSTRTHHKSSFTVMYHMSSHKCSTVWLYAVLLYATFTVMSMKRDIDTHASASSSSAPKSLRLDKFVQHRDTKAGLVAILQTLHDQGLLEKRYTIKQMRKEVSSHAQVQTPFGKVIQTFRIGGSTKFSRLLTLVLFCGTSVRFQFPSQS